MRDEGERGRTLEAHGDEADHDGLADELEREEREEHGAHARVAVVHGVYP